MFYDDYFNGALHRTHVILIKEPSQSSVIRVPFKSLWSKESMKVIVPSSAFDARFV